ncbi:MAG: alpha/beta hydrolase [Tidjanibacter sp.]|nr:alpha/beta hydrolase [Tidjanibacter sp.]MBR6813884.1 alpha/beta hydrolase [Tidjanibacter sp.]
MKRVLTVVVCLLFSATLSAQFGRTYVYKTVQDIAYRAENPNDYAAERCKLDIYYPSDKENFSTLIWYHGGGLTGGQKSVPAELMNKGIAVVAVGYRLSPGATVEECIDDAAAAAAWVVKHIAEYGGNPDMLFVSGHSAGGYLTSMIGMDKRWLAPYGVDPDEAFAALLPYSGQAITHFTRRSELGMKDTQPLVDELSPLYHVRPDCAPMVIYSGDRELEMLGRYEENAYLWRMMKICGHPDVTLYELDGFNHNTMASPAHQLAVQYIRTKERAASQQR